MVVTDAVEALAGSPDDINISFDFGDRDNQIVHEKKNKKVVLMLPSPSSRPAVAILILSWWGVGLSSRHHPSLAVTIIMSSSYCRCFHPVIIALSSCHRHCLIVPPLPSTLSQRRPVIVQPLLLLLLCVILLAIIIPSSLSGHCHVLLLSWSSMLHHRHAPHHFYK
uniref:Uncharacterized protein n=1 Tax=Romanomermis culicivorax TaxID=13658 RepID=A0A915ISD3_ROMCU